MHSIKLIAALVIFISLSVQAQQSTSTQEHSATTEIHNDNGKLYLLLTDGEITKFTINDKAVSKDRYDNYKEIVDEFSDDGIESYATPAPPVPPRTRVSAEKRNNGNQTQKLKELILGYLVVEGTIRNTQKYRVHLKKSFLEVNGSKMSTEMHKECLRIFKKMYGYKLNAESEVVFKKSKNSTSSSVSITD